MCVCMCLYLVTFVYPEIDVGVPDLSDSDNLSQNYFWGTKLSKNAVGFFEFGPENDL